MIKIIKALVLLCWLGLSWQASAQSFSLKTNLLYWGTLTPNLSGEIALNSRYSLDLQAAYRPWGGIKAFDMRFWLAQPELRYWFCETFEGHFMGLHLHGAQYDGAIHDRHYDGYLAGGGFTYGYQWILSPHWTSKPPLEWAMPVFGMISGRICLAKSVHRASTRIIWDLPRWPLVYVISFNENQSV